MPRSSVSAIWYRPQGGDAQRLDRDYSQPGAGFMASVTCALTAHVGLGSAPNAIRLHRIWDYLTYLTATIYVSRDFYAEMSTV